MSRSRAFCRWTGATVLASLVGLGAAGCIVAPVGGYAEPALVVPAPGVVVAPGPVIYGPSFYGPRYYGHGYYGHGYYGHGYYGRGYRGPWRGWRG